jgi:hypothetical protein
MEQRAVLRPYLDRFDKAALQRGLKLVRYADGTPVQA